MKRWLLKIVFLPFINRIFYGNNLFFHYFLPKIHFIKFVLPDIFLFFVFLVLKNLKFLLCFASLCKFFLAFVSVYKFFGCFFFATNKKTYSTKKIFPTKLQQQKKSRFKSKSFEAKSSGIFFFLSNFFWLLRLIIAKPYLTMTYSYLCPDLNSF